MAKNIIVCSDGTGNTAIKGRGTNVFKLFEAVDLNSHRYDPSLKPQVSIYDDGVGTERFKPLKLLGGAGGFGLSRNVRQLYKELCRIYDPEDRIFLFGFSRGAFTVRTLAGLIAACGLLKVDVLHDSDTLERRVVEAYKAYRRRYRTSLMKLVLGEPKHDELERFKETHSHGNERIAFIGVWDTVDAVGLPLPIADFVNRFVYQFKFPNLTLSPSVDRAYHALAIDDERESFHPLLWDEPRRAAPSKQIIQQVWFAGAHSNVGGGYPKQGMSLVALDWMMTHAETAGLRFISAQRANYRDRASVDDKLYDPRSGLGIFYRWMPRDVAAICRERGNHPTVHSSVLERAAHGTEDYSPGNLPPNASVDFTRTGDDAKDAVARDRATKVQAVLRASGHNGHSLLDKVQREMRIGRNSYVVFLTACVVLLFGALAPEPLELRWSLLTGAGRDAYELLMSPLAASFAATERLFMQPWRILVPALGFALAAVMASGSKRRRRKCFSAFWFKQQKFLREALKSTREPVLESQVRELFTDSTPAAVAERPSDSKSSVQLR